MRASPRTARARAVATLVVTLAGCASGPRLTDGRYVSPKGYGVTAPSAAWTVVPDGEADVQWRRAAPEGRMLVNAECEDVDPRRPLGLLARQLLRGVRDRTVIERGEVTIAQHTARHVVLEGRPADEPGRVRVEVYVLKNDRCVYDLLYAAPVDAFEASRPEFRRVVDSFTMK